MQRPAFLEYQDFRYLKAAAVLAGLAVPAYWLTTPAGGAPYGGTWFGYGLGIASALLVVLLAWYGVRKRLTPRMPERRRGNRRRAFYADDADDGGDARRRADRRNVRAENHWRYGNTVQGWLSAHVYLGLALVALATLHAGFRFHWNLHTLAYALTLATVASGIYGTVAYLRYPRRITDNLGNDSLSGLLASIAELDELARVRALELPDEVNALVTQARLETRIGGDLFQQLRCRLPFCPTAFAVQRVQELGKQLVEGDQPRLIRDLYAVLLKKQQLVTRARNDIAFNARMKFWLHLHVPLTAALLAALAAHVLAVLIYW